MIDTKILKIDENSLKFAKDLILNGDVVGIPTETVYGLGGIAYSDEAIKKIYEIKGRPSDNPLIVHVHKDYDISELVYVDFDYVYELQKAFLPGPLTMVYRSKGKVSKLVSCGLDTLALRVPSHEGCQEFLRYVGVPIAAPSANISKHTSPVTAQHVYDDFNEKISLILDGGKSMGGIESTVLDVTTEMPTILRSGLITAEMIKNVVGKCAYSDSKPTDKVRSPGCKYRHYCPKCDTALFDREDYSSAIKLYDETVSSGKRACFMCDEKMRDKIGDRKVLSLGSSGEEIASNLYFKLREAETVTDLLIAFKVETGSELDVGIMNRLSKACKPKDKD